MKAGLLIREVYQKWVRLKSFMSCQWCMQSQGLVESLDTASLSAANGGLVRSVLACGFYPLVGRLLPPKGNQGGSHGKAVIITARDEKVTVSNQWLPALYTDGTVVIVHIPTE